ncbi:hypothetical protein [Pontibacter beigongshangensis]|uniref:hypothetical protein n=1 Tax=Pontibacter beigongshangensis TaxID=2574733 RepID=UPI00164EF1C5|nr:hypothetical protein [Pontibacter beigongshangensis]
MKLLAVAAGNIISGGSISFEKLLYQIFRAGGQLKLLLLLKKLVLSGMWKTLFITFANFNSLIWHILLSLKHQSRR